MNLDWRKAADDVRKRLAVRAGLGITIESGDIFVDIVRCDENGCRVTRSFALGIGAAGFLASPEKAGEILTSRLASEGVKERRAIVCLPPSWALTAPIDAPPDLAGEDLQGYLELRADREFPVSDLRLTHNTFTLPDGTRAATLAGVPAKRLAAVDAFLQKAGCRAISVSLGLDRVLGSGPALHFLANGNHVDVAVAAGGGVAALRSLPTGDASGLFPEIRITLGRLPGGMKIGEARFTGGELADQLYAGLEAPLRRAGIESKRSADASHPGAAAAERALRKEPAPFEFLSPRINKWQAAASRFETRQRRWLLAGAVALVLLPIIIFWWRASTESSLNAEWNRMAGPVSDLEEIQRKIRSFRSWFDTNSNAVQLLDNLATAFPEQGDVWAKSIEVAEAGAKITCTGFARNQAAFLSMRDQLSRRKGVSAVQIQQVRGDNPVQFTLTYRWERPTS